MSEIKRKVQPVTVSMECDKCRKGNMMSNGRTLMSHPPKYSHKCTNCENIENYNKIYPCIEYEPYYDQPINY